MDFVISNKKQETYKENIHLNDSLYLSYTNNISEQNDLLINHNDYILISSANKSFINLLNKSQNKLPKIDEIITNLENGFIILYNKTTNELKVYNDTFGFYHLFFIKKNNEFYISSNFENLISFSNQEVNTYAILDLVLFNYTLLNRTLLADVKRLEGGNQIIIQQNNFELFERNNFAKNFKVKTKKYRPKIKPFAEIIKNSLKKELEDAQKVILTMTAGFDSRALLSALNNLNFNFSSVTFGQKGNIEQETIKSFIGNYSNSHRFIKLDEKYIANVNSLLHNYCSINMDNPVILDLLYDTSLFP